MSPCIEDLRARIRLLERASHRPGGVLPFGIAAIDDHLPGGGLALGSLHDIAGGGADEVHAAAAALFTAGLLARMEGMALWTTTAPDLFAPGLACAGLPPERLLYASAPDEKTVLLVMEEALRHASLCAVVGEVAKLSMVASRRLVLAAEKSGAMAVVLRRRREGKPADATLTAAATRWRITPLPSAALPSPGIGRARWQVELIRCRGGEPAYWIMEACDAQGRLSLPPHVADRSASQKSGGQGRHAA